MKKAIDTKKQLFENMAKLNPDFKPKEILSEDKKWIQKAVNPEHKGYCTPMTKPTCTPQRKALAKRFKKGIENEAYGTPAPYGKSMAKPMNEITERGKEVIYKFKTDAITETMGSRDGKQYSHPVYLIEGNPKYAPIYNGVVLSINNTPGSWYVDTLMEGDAKNNDIMYIDYGAKWICSNWSEIMKELNEWTSNNKNDGIPMEKPMNEKVSNENYRFQTLSAALDAVREKVGQKGYTVDEDAIWEQFGTGGISYGQSKANVVIPLLKDGVPAKNRSITVSIYRTENGLYELISNMN